MKIIKEFVCIIRIFFTKFGFQASRWKKITAKTGILKITLFHYFPYGEKRTELVKEMRT